MGLKDARKRISERLHRAPAPEIRKIFEVLASTTLFFLERYGTLDYCFATSRPPLHPIAVGKSRCLHNHRHPALKRCAIMGSGKKEAARKIRQGKTGDGMANVKVKGENFYRSGARVKTLNQFKEGRPERNANGEITKAASFQSREKPSARVEPNRKWFTNTRVISQDALTNFRDAVEAQSKDPYSYLLKQNKLPMSLIHDGKEKERKDGLVQHKAKIRIESEGFSETFGPKAQRKRPRLAVGSLEDMANASGKDYGTFLERAEEARLLSGHANDEQREDPMSDYLATATGELTTAREPVFSKGQSKRIWNELYKVIDSSDVVIHVLDARDPLGTRCRSVEKYIREEAPHKHLLFLLNKCDLVPTGVAVCLPSSIPISLAHSHSSSQDAFLPVTGRCRYSSWRAPVTAVADQRRHLTTCPLPSWHDLP